MKGLVKDVIEKSSYNKIEYGRLIKSVITNLIRVYDVDGKEIENTIYESDGKFAFKYSYKYDENRLKTSVIKEVANNQIEEIKFDFADGIYNKLYTRKFSGNFGNLDENGWMQIYDSKGDMTTWNFDAINKHTYEYDSEGRIKMRTQWHNGKMKIRTRYSYKDDKYGNWIEQYESNNFPFKNNQDIDPDEWYKGETNYREISYY